MHYLRALVDRDQADPGDGGTVVFSASTDDPGRDKLVIDQTGWELDNFKANPVIMFAHDYSRPPIGRAVDVGVSDGRLFVGVKFDGDDPFAAEIERKIRAGYLNAVSVGWDVIERQANRIVRQDLLEVSVVPIPADPGALIQRQQRAYAALSADLAALLGTRAGTCPHCGSGQRGENLAGFLNEVITGLISDDRPAEMIIAELADAAGIDASTVSQILAGEINCPPLERLEGFATSLGVPVADLVAAAEADGCKYDDEDDDDGGGTAGDDDDEEMRGLAAELSLRQLLAAVS